MRRLIGLGIILILAGTGHADVVKLRGGGEIEGLVLQETDTRITVRMAYGTVTLARSQVASIEKKPFTEPPPRRATEKESENRPAEGVASRIPDWRQTVESLSKQEWAENVTQIPATVIDKGVLRNVPYTSYRVANDYEVNIYGDPDSPAGIEIGVYRELLGSDAAKRNCVEFVAGLLSDNTDAKILRALKPSIDSASRGGLTIEITPPTSEDAYGGWWVSVYDEHSLDGMRASEAELAAITVARNATPVDEQPPKGTDLDKPRAPEPSVDPVDWLPSEMRYARPAPPSAAESSSPGRVYVRGYYRKDGTYVRAHTRRR